MHEKSRHSQRLMNGAESVVRTLVGAGVKVCFANPGTSEIRRYLAIGSVVRLKAVLDQENVHLPVRTDGAGKITGGGLISRGHLYKILSNPIYVGRLSHCASRHHNDPAYAS